jgi:hypothetical protein
MKKINLLSFILISLLFASCSAMTGKTNVKMPEVETAPLPPPDNSSAELNRIKKLAGRWSAKTSMFGKKDEEVFTEYAVTAAGSAVIETIFPGTQNEMISVYFDDDQGKLAMTHYCMMRNRPSFALASSTPKMIKLDVVKVEGLKSEDSPSMGAITIKFEGENSFSTTCEGGGKSGKKNDPVTMRYTRVKK